MATTWMVEPCRESRQQAASGGCALRGAKLALQPITNAVHVVHGSASCLGHVWSSRPTASSGSHLHRYSVTTALGEVELILGGTARLQDLLDRIVVELAPAAIFVYQSCVTAMMGEDLRAECHAATERLGLPVLAVEASGLDGGKQRGHQLAVKLLCDQVIGTIEPAFRSPADINLIGEFNVCGEVSELRGILRHMGIRILASIPGDARYQEIATAHRANVSLDLCSQAMPDLAENLERTYGIPCVRGSLYGSRSFAGTLRRLALVLIDRGAEKIILDKLDLWIEQQQKRFEKLLAGYRKRLAGKRVLVYLGGVKTWSLIDDLQSAGLIVRGISLHKCSERDRSIHLSIKQRCRQQGLPEWQDSELEELLRGSGIDLILSGSSLKYQAQKYAIPCVDLSHERDFSLLGYEGVLRVLAEIDRLLSSPVWKLSATTIENVAPASASSSSPAIHSNLHLGSINPFALTQPIGAVLALQGIRRCHPLLFGAQGCATSGTVFLSRYFGEQITLDTVAMNEHDTISGGHQALRSAIARLGKQSPEMIAVVTTGAIEAQGASAVSMPPVPSVSAARQPLLLFLHTPDFEGSLQDGWGKATHAVVSHLLGDRTRSRTPQPQQLVILPGSHLSIGDIEWIKETVADFGLSSLVLPDISTALDGRFGPRNRSAFDGGVSLSALEQLGDSVSYLAFGEQMRASADELTRAGLPGTLLPTVTGLQQTDTLLQYLSQISGRPIAEKYHMQRSQLLDAMIDNARNLGHMRAAIAAEPDLLFDLSAWLCELGAKPQLAVSPTRSETLHRLPVDRVYIGDYQLLESRIDACNLLLAPDSARTLAREQHLAHYAIGLHEQRHAGAQHLTRMGYRGARDQLFHLVNLLM